MTFENMFSQLTQQEQEQDFLLPYDVYLEFYREHNGQSYRSGWSKIKKSIYVDVEETKAEEVARCDCMGDSKCSSDECINRCMYIECDPAHCKNCLNQRIRHFEYLQPEEFDIKFHERKGWAFHTNVKIEKGQYIYEYTGEVISVQLFKERLEEMSKLKNYYFLQIQNRVIDAFKRGSEARFVNHSCDPNCEVQVWTVNHEKRICLFALRNIKQGEEITYDYNYSADISYPCFCGASNCSGIMGKKLDSNRSLLESAQRLTVSQYNV
eukprot:NODE_40_length_35084_cov_0.543519.p14 type:complete len:267 gc:universal NODE_40_length_35084_cov_0.543519:1685-2485(+)